MKAYKGFDKDLKCRGFQYEIGKEYETDKAIACETGFHACEYPLDVLGYYPPNVSRYCEVEQSGETDKRGDDTKVASTKIKIGAEIGIAGLVKAAVEYTKERATEVKGGRTSQDYGAASATGKASVALVSGRYGRAMGGLWSAICIVERGEYDGETYPIIAIKAAIVDGETIKPGIWYTLKDGEFTEVE